MILSSSSSRTTKSSLSVGGGQFFFLSKIFLLLLLAGVPLVVVEGRGMLIEEIDIFGGGYEVKVLQEEGYSAPLDLDTSDGSSDGSTTAADDSDFLGGGVTKGNITTFLQLPCIVNQPLRLETAAKMIQLDLIGQTTMQLDSIESVLKELVHKPTASSSFMYDVIGFQQFVGLTEIAEFFTYPRLTNNFYTFLQRNVVEMECFSSSSLIVSYREIIKFNYFQDTLHHQGYTKLNFASSPQENNPNNNITTQANAISNKLISLETKLSPIIIQALSENFIGPMSSAKDMCNEAALQCNGDLFPFDTLQDCYEILGSIPSACKDEESESEDDFCYDCLEANTAFLGDTRHCRHYHMLHTKLRPESHCFELGNITTQCIPSQCTKFGSPPEARITIEESIEVNNLIPFDATLANWLRTIEGIVGLLALVMPIITFLLYRRTRSTTFANINNINNNTKEEDQQQTTTPQTQTSNNDETTSSTTKQVAEITTSSTDDDNNNDNNTSGKELPVMNVAFRLLRKQQPNPEDPQAHIVVHTDGIDIGGCKLTAVNGPSGCGKSTLMKLLCGFPQPHMKLELEVCRGDLPLSEIPVAYTPQSSELWPRNMTVKDILGFAALLQGCDMAEYMDCLQVLQLQQLLEQPFNTLSGGQQQRVHFLANMIRSEPSILFMDEPLSALDEENAVAALELLRHLPVAHSFVITVHRISPVLRVHFDRILEIDLFSKKMIKHHISKESKQSSDRLLKQQANNNIKDMAVQEEQEVEEEGEEVQAPQDHDDDYKPPSIKRRGPRPFTSCVKSMFYLWHSMFWGWPALDFGLVLIGAATAMILGFMGEDTLAAAEALGFIPNATAARMPVYMLQFVANAAALSAFVVSLIISNQDRMVLEHFVIQGDLGGRAVAFFNFLRFCFYGIVLSIILMMIPLAIMGLVDEYWDIMVMNVAFFAASYQYLCYTITLAVSPVYGPHLLLVTFLPMTMFTGLFFPWSTLSPFFKLFHYVNPVFYCMTACSHLLLATFETNCPPVSYPYLICASSADIAEITELQDFGSRASQIVSAIVLLLAIVGFLRLYRRKPAFKKLDHHETLARHESVTARAVSVLSSLRSHRSTARRKSSSMRDSASTWLDAKRMSVQQGGLPKDVLMSEHLGSIDEGGDKEDRQRQLSEEIYRLRAELEDLHESARSSSKATQEETPEKGWKHDDEKDKQAQEQESEQEEQQQPAIEVQATIENGTNRTTSVVSLG